MQNVSSSNWDREVLLSKKLTLVEFWAPWCPWCRRLTPILQEMEGEYQGKMLFLMLNADENPDIAARYGVMGLPTIKFFCDGRVVGEIIGFMPKEHLRHEFEDMIARYRECLTQSSSYIR